MNLITPRRALVACVTWLLASAAAPAGAQTIDDFFNPEVVQEVRLWINSRDLQTLRARFTEDTYYTADLEWRGLRVRNVGVRSRGGGSRNDRKLGLRVEFDHYAKGQRFLGLQTLTLNNVWQEPSMLHESVTMTFFRRMGQPAPRVSFARLILNNQYAGVYLLEELVDPLFLQRTLGRGEGYLFEFIYLNDLPFFGGFLGDDFAPYKRLFETKDPHKLDSDSLLFTPIVSLFRDVAQPVDDVWRESVGRYLDLPQFVTHIAIENFLAELDGVLGYAGMNNFYLFRPAGSDQHRFVVKDKSETFYLTEFPIFLRVEENVLATGALSFPDLRATYLDTLLQGVTVANEPDVPGGAGWLEREITRQSDLIRDAVLADPVKQFSNDAFEQEVERLKAFARGRGAFVTAEVAKERTR
jgi:CotH protein